MTKRSFSHFEKGEPILECILRKLRFERISKHIASDSTVLDIGCGHQAKFLTSIYKKINKGVGIDINTIQKLPSNISIKNINVDGKKLPFKAKSFDHIVSTALLEHLNHPQKLLDESYRILKKKGVLTVTTPSKYAKPILEFLSFKIGVVSKEEIRDHKLYYNKVSLEKALVSAGFKKKNIETIYFQFGLNIFAKAIK